MVNRHRAILVFILFVLLIRKVQATTILNVTKGETLILKCPGKPVILWGDNNDNVLAHGVTVNGNIALSNRLAVTKDHHLVIKNFSYDDPRIYLCETDEPKRFSFEVNMMQRPYLVGSNIYRFSASIQERSYISFNVSSDTQPDVSWTETSGGKLGYWNVYASYEEREMIHNVSTMIYNISSTILPSDKSHIGRYAFLVRNSVGSIEIYMDLVDDTISVFPMSAACNISSEVTFACNMSKVMNGKPFLSSWTHLYNGKQIRNFSSTVVEMVAFLTITHCDYRDIGIYMCECTNGRHMYSAFSLLTVNSSPIYISQRKILILGQLALELQFYSVPKPDKVIWLYNDRHIDNLQQITRHLNETRVKINLYNTDLETDGYIAAVVVNYSHNLDSRLYSCQVRNNFGTMEARFKDTLIIENATTVGYESDWNRNRNYVIYGAALCVAFLSAGIIAGTILMHRKTASDRAQENDQEVEPGIHVSNSVETSRNPSYEEIDNVSYQSVTWRNYSIETDSSEGEEDVPETYANDGVPSGYLQCNQNVRESHKYEIYSIETNTLNH